MNPSPIGSKLLSIYAILFAGLAPGALLMIAAVNGAVSLPYALGSFGWCVSIVYFGVRVLTGDYSATRQFAILVALSYLGLTAANAWNINDFPAESRAAQMAIPRMIRGVLFAGVYIWYYLIRKKTPLGFKCATGGHIGPA